MIIFVVVLGVATFYKGYDGAHKNTEVKFSTFATHLEKGKYEKLNITDRKMTATLKNGDKEYAYAPSAIEINWLETNYIFPQIKEGKLKLASDPPESSVNFFSLLPTIIMVVALGFLFYFMMSQGGNNKAFQFGKNRAKLYKENGKNIKFEDVAGLKEEKEELEEAGILEDISHMPARVKCAVLAWHTMDEIFKDAEEGKIDQYSGKFE